MGTCYENLILTYSLYNIFQYSVLTPDDPNKPEFQTLHTAAGIAGSGVARFDGIWSRGLGLQDVNFRYMASLSETCKNGERIFVICGVHQLQDHCKDYSCQ